MKRKAAGKTIEVPEEKEEESNVIDLMDALQQSLGRKHAAKRPKSRKKALRPIVAASVGPRDEEPQAIEAMEARSVDAIPTGEQWQYEPKWDGFRCLLVRHADTVDLYSKSGQKLDRYFPELVEGALALGEKRLHP